MSNLIRKVALAGAVCGLAASAQAQDLDGGYVGVFARNNVSAPSNVDVGFGAFGGWNVAMSSGLIVGVEGELEVDPNAPSPPFGGNVWSAGSDVNGVASVRFGTDVGGALLFAKTGAGYSSALSGMVWGVGGGVDYPMSGKMFMRAEYQHLRPVTAGPPARNNVKVGFGYQF